MTGKRIKNAILFFVFHLFFFASALAWAVEEHAAEHHGNPSPGIDLIFREFNFVLLLAILFFLLRKPVKEYFAARAGAIKVSIKESQKLHEEAKEQYEKINKRLQGIDQETKELVDSFRQEGELEKKKLLEQAKKYSQKIKEDAKKIADNELKKAKEELKETAVHISKDLAQKMIENEMTEDDQERLAEDFLKGLRKLH